MKQDLKSGNHINGEYNPASALSAAPITVLENLEVYLEVYQIEKNNLQTFESSRPKYVTISTKSPRLALK